MTVAITVLVCLTVALGVFLWRALRESSALKSRYGSIIDTEAEISRRKQLAQEDLQKAETSIAEAASRLNELTKSRMEAESVAEQQRTSLASEYADALSRYTDLKHEVSLLEENLEDLSFGLYRPHFNFGTPEDYKLALERVRDQERDMVRSGLAAIAVRSGPLGKAQGQGRR